MLMNLGNVKCVHVAFSATDTNMHWSLAICIRMIQWKLFNPITAESIAYGPRFDIWWDVLS